MLAPSAEGIRSPALGAGFVNLHPILPHRAGAEGRKSKTTATKRSGKRSGHHPARAVHDAVQCEHAVPTPRGAGEGTPGPQEGQQTYGG